MEVRDDPGRRDRVSCRRAVIARLRTFDRVYAAGQETAARPTAARAPVNERNPNPRGSPCSINPSRASPRFFIPTGTERIPRPANDNLPRDPNSGSNPPPGDSPPTATGSGDEPPYISILARLREQAEQEVQVATSQLRAYENGQINFTAAQLDEIVLVIRIS